MDSVLEKLGIYELLCILFAGSVITYCSIVLNDFYFGYNVNLSYNGINKTLLFILISCFIGFLFQELGSIIMKRILFRKNGLLKRAYIKDNERSKYLSESEFNKLEALFRRNNVKDLKEKYNKCKYYIISKGNTLTIDKELALSSMSRSFFVYSTTVAFVLLIDMIFNMNCKLLIPFILFSFISVVMYFRLKRFAIMRYVHIFRIFLYENS